MEDEKVDKERYVVQNEKNVEKFMNDKMEGSEPEKSEPERDPNTKFCPACGKKIKKASRFCCYCGERQPEWRTAGVGRASEETISEKIPVNKTKMEKEASSDKTSDVRNASGQETLNNIGAKLGETFENFKESLGNMLSEDGEEGNNNFYIVEFAKNIARKSNTSILIYLILNVFIISFVIGVMFRMESMFAALLVGILLYAVSMTIALSFVGEAILRLQTGCHKIKRQDQFERIQPAFQEVYEKAKVQTPSIPDDVQIYINGDKSPNAFATGRKTICVTEGLLDRPLEEIKATLGHEFGHLAHHDTDLILVISIGNLVVTIILLLIKLFITLFSKGVGLLCSLSGILGGFFIVGTLADWLVRLSGFLANLCVSGGMWLWMQLGNLLVLQSCRANEFEADEYAFRLGYGNALCQLFDNLDDGERSQGLFASLASTHPAANDRIQRLQELGVEYRHVYGADN